MLFSKEKKLSQSFCLVNYLLYAYNIKFKSKFNTKILTRKKYVKEILVQKNRIAQKKQLDHFLYFILCI